jgi:hypothetical protein
MYYGSCRVPLVNLLRAGAKEVASDAEIEVFDSR